MSIRERLRNTVAPFPAGFFKFDIKDSIKLLMWVVMAAFALGGVWAQLKTDGVRISDQVGQEKVARQELTSRVTRLEQTDAAVLASMESLHTELRYVNDKIDVLREDVRRR